MTSNTTGANNTAVGAYALDACTTGQLNVAVGSNALTALTTGEKNISVGYNAGAAITNSEDTVSIGQQASEALTTGDRNIAIGTRALDSNSTSDDNVAVGHEAYRLGTLSGNTVVGSYALDASTTGSNNVAIGYAALGASVTGNSNVAIGHEAMANSDVSSPHNVAVGRRAGWKITSGQENTCLGQYTAAYVTPLTTGDYNIYIGSYAQASNANAQKEIMLGYNTMGSGDGTFRVRAPNGSYNTANNANWNTTSDRRIKKSIVNNDSGLDKLKQIQVRNFEYKTEDEIKTDNPELTDVIGSAVVDTPGTQIGVIAQELETVLPECVTESSLGIKNVNPNNLTWYLINAVKELSTKNDALEARIATLEGS